MRKIRKFNGEDDSYVEGTASSLRDDANDANIQSKALAELIAPTETEPEAPAKALAAPKPQNFKSAFAEARSAGEKTFEFGGKKYTTELAKKAAPKVRETTVADVFPVLTGEKKRAEEKMDKKQFRAEQNAQIIAREAARAKAKAKAKESETRTPKRSGNLTDMLGLSSRYASGGSVSSRADGIAQRGKTRGKMC